jgi:hypothetical protein
MSKRIPINELKDGFLYEIEARNQNRGIWRESEKGFEIARTKFDKTFLFVEYEWGSGNEETWEINGKPCVVSFATARAFREIEKVPEELLSDDVKRLEYLVSFKEPTNHDMCRYTKDEEFKKYVDRFGWPTYE